MRFLEQCFLILFQTSLTASIIILMVFAVLRIFKNKINIKFKYILLNLILIRLIVPVIPETNINLNISELFNRFQEEKYEDVIGQSESVLDFKNDSQKMFNKEQNILNYENSDMDEINVSNQNSELLKNTIDFAAILWCTGIAVLMSILIISLFCFKRKFKNSKRTDDDNIIRILNKLKQDITLKKDIPVHICDERKSPCIFGIIRPRIYLPKYVLEFDEDMISHILLHELMHYKRKDLYINILSWIILLLHWFNPLVWILENKLKVYREYICDFYVLESLGEEKNIDYGMTIINLSKVFTNNKGFQFGLGFERNNIIKGRIEMIKDFKKGSYKISAKAALGCLVAAVVICTNGITVNALDINNSLIENNVNETSLQNKHEFLIDSELKSYDDINKVKEVAGFDFKLPENILQRNKPESYQVIKVSDTSNQVVAYFDGSEERNTFSLIIFKDDDAEQGLSKYFENRHNYNKDQIESNSELMSLGNIKGYKVNLKVTTPEDHFENYIIPECIEKYSYFVWQNDGVWYGIQYENYYESEGKTKVKSVLSSDELSKIASSLKNIDEIKNINYLTVADKELSTELGIMSIYDKDDLQKAENMMGVSLKLPLVINNNPIQFSTVGITGDSDVENDKVYYELLNIYNKEDCYVNLFQSKHDAFNRYNDAKNNGYVYLDEDKKVSIEKIDIDGNTVYRFMEKDIDEENSKENIAINYLWQEDGVYYYVSMWNTDGYHDDIAKEVIESKHIE